MKNFPIQIRQDDAAREMASIERKVLSGMQELSKLKDEDVDIGSTPKDVVYERETWKLYHYHPTVAEKDVHPIPMLIIPPLINGYEVADLQPDRSLVRNFLAEGIDVYLLNWGYPKRCDMYLSWDDYVCDFIDDAVDFIRKDRGLESINLFGICQGGTMSVCYCALFPEKIKSLTLTVTPIDFSRGKVEGKPHVGLLFEMGRNADVDLMRDAFGLIPADVLNVSFLMASPFTLMFGKYADMVDILDNREALLNFLRMEKWLFGGPGVSGEAYRQLVRTFLQGNALVNGELELDGQKVDLKNITMPILNIYAERDHLVPPPCTTALGEHVGNKDGYEELCIKTGHIGIYTGGASQKILAPTAAKWIKEHN
ncbi:MAG: class III poly(R)-hydroxyalkanoic acid synthase subunit PhaC [Rhodospirillales bacterium]|nr:class III poly(R)-hydroxyalkanoic acid synthase subunit PhaC [Rhodospirillales bacterium]